MIFVYYMTGVAVGITAGSMFSAWLNHHREVRPIHPRALDD